MNLIEAPDGTRIVTIDGVLPTSVEWDEIFSNGYSLNVISMPNGSSTLDALLPVRERIQQIAINSYSCSDLRTLDQMPNLRELVIGGRVVKAPSLTQLNAFESFTGPLAKFSGVAALQTMRKIEFDCARKALPPIHSAIRELGLISIAESGVLSQLRDPAALERLSIHRASDLDLGRVAEFGELRLLHIEDCKSLRNVRALLGVKSLTRIILENCAVLDDTFALIGLECEVRVIGKNPFTLRFRESVGNNWIFPPGRAFLPS